tara:strand:- start:8312 stop:8506 length:195 start_codon:yes stop_codon:yes gene_type:complete
MCTTTEETSIQPEDIEWCYGIYVASVEEERPYDGFCGHTERYDRILHNGRFMNFDHYWHIERIS